MTGGALTIREVMDGLKCCAEAMSDCRACPMRRYNNHYIEVMCGNAYEIMLILLEAVTDKDEAHEYDEIIEETDDGDVS